MRSLRADSIDAQIKMAQPKLIVIPAHVPLETEDLPFWNSVLLEFARSEWTDHQLELAAMLARTMSDLEKEQRALREEGSVSKSDKGTPVVNPRKAIIQMHAGTILSFRRSLSLTARSQDIKLDTVGRQRAFAKETESGFSEDANSALRLIS